MSVNRPIVHNVCTVMLAVGVTAVTLGGCSSTSQPSELSSSAMSTPHESRPATVIAPVAIDLATVNATTVAIPLGNAAYIIVPDGSEADYTATLSHAGVITFTSGSIADSVVLRPGLTSIDRGATEVTMTNVKTGAVTQFTVQVK